MANSKIGKKSVVFSNSFVGNKGDIFRLYPLPDEKEFLVEIDVQIDKDGKTSATAIDGGSKITFAGPFTDDLSFGTAEPLDFASNDKFNLYISLAAGFIGSENSIYTIVLFVTVLSLER